MGQRLYLTHSPVQGTSVESSRKEEMRSELEDVKPPGAASAPVLFYSESVLDHFSNPRNVGRLDHHTSGFAVLGDPSCGDQMKLWISVDSDRICDIAFQSFGCPGAIATSSMLTVLAKDKTIEDAKRITDDDVVEALGGIPANKRHCSLLGVRALQAALEDFERRQNRPWRWKFWKHLIRPK
jgi:nitrogen fixation protein NifU and related proteins